jgi:hypothetical protein
VIVDANGVPLGFHFVAANTAEVTAVEPTLARIRVPRRRGRPKSQPTTLLGDKAYDSAGLRRRLRHRGIAPRLPRRKRPKAWKRGPGRPVREAPWPEAKFRYVVERSFAWFGKFRRLLIRWERSLEHYAGLFTLANIMLLMPRVLA